MHNSIAQNPENKPLTPYLWLIVGLQGVFFLLLLKSPDYAILFVGLVALMFALIRFPEIGLANAFTSNILLMVIFDNLNTPIPMPVLLLYLFMVWGGALYYYLDHQDEVKLDFGGPVRISFLLTALLFIGLLYSADRSYGMQKLVFFILFNITLLLAPMVFVRDIVRFENMIKLAYLFGLVLGIVATFIALATPESERFRPSENVNPIWLARSLGVTAVAGMYMVVTAKRGMAKAIYGLSLLFFIYPILRSWSRAPLLGLVLVLVLYFLLQPNRSMRKKILVSSALGIGLVVVVLNTASGIAARLQTPLAMEWSAAFRIVAWIEAFNDFLSAPLWGIGVGSFYLDLAVQQFIYPHNLILEMAAETGVTGLFLILVFIFLTFGTAIKKIRIANSAYIRLIANFFLIGFFYALWNSMFSGDVSMNESIWLFSGLIHALPTGSRYLQQ